MKRLFQKHLVASVGVLALASACGGAMDDVDQADAVQQPGSRIHVMKKTQPGDEANTRTAQVAAHLNYYGGPVLTHVNVIPVYWNSSVAYQSNLNSFYSAIPASSTIYTTLLGQYSGIGTGTRGTPYVDTKTTGTYTDAQVQAELNRLFTAGVIPQPNGSNYYPVHFPSGVTVVDSSGSASCTQWCAYHGTYVRNGVNVNYGIIPDQGGGCAGGCGSNSQRVNNLTSVSSHELVEATTDPAVGLALDYAPPLAWYDPTYGEIGDICNASQATITVGTTSYVVQKEWSNSKGVCTTN
ncbi:MAG: hypothetical protein ACJ8AT_11675 [Hyalangium sp.]|uniref:hypothetical protein n=1 Tax=Hyalangium sp. TaxID=2028555 RepID=UPI00389B387E